MKYGKTDGLTARITGNCRFALRRQEKDEE
jgi:hypothetical protein